MFDVDTIPSQAVRADEGPQDRIPIATATSVEPVSEGYMEGANHTVRYVLVRSTDPCRTHRAVDIDYEVLATFQAGELWRRCNDHALSESSRSKGGESDDRLHDHIGKGGEV